MARNNVTASSWTIDSGMVRSWSSHPACPLDEVGCASQLRIRRRRLHSVKMVLSDTDDKALAVQLAVLRRLGPSERMRLAAEMSEDVRRIAFEAEQRRHPELSAVEARQAVLDRIWGADLAAAVRRSRAER